VHDDNPFSPDDLPDGEDDDDLSFSDFSSDEDDDDGAFPPPEEPVEVRCIHCGKEFLSSAMVKRWQEHMSEFAWCCPDDECDGVGFCFDIWPLDPDWRDASGDAVHDDALPANFPEKREDCVWLDADEEILCADEFRVGGYERQARIDSQTDVYWPPGSKPSEPGDDGYNDIPF
jgi:hypothetical protein